MDRTYNATHTSFGTLVLRTAANAARYRAKAAQGLYASVLGSGGALLWQLHSRLYVACHYVQGVGMRVTLHTKVPQALRARGCPLCRGERPAHGPAVAINQKDSFDYTIDHIPSTPCARLDRYGRRVVNC